MREKEDKIFSELKIIVKLVWQYFHKGEVSTNLKASLSPVIHTIQMLGNKHGRIVSKVSLEEIVQSLSIQKFLHFVFIEAKSNAYSLLVGHRVVMTRLFFLKKGPTSSSNTRRTIRHPRRCWGYQQRISL